MSYDRALTVFSPDGHLFQVDYAMETVKRGTSAVGIRGKGCVVLGVEKKNVQKLQEERTIRKICAIDEHICLVSAGLSADARVLINMARQEAQSHRLTVEDPASIGYMASHIASIKQKYTQRGGVRPFGVSTLLMGVEAGGRGRLYLTEPSGIHTEWRACAIGRSDKVIKDFLEKAYFEIEKKDIHLNIEGNESTISLEASLKLAVRALLEVVQTGSSSMEIAYMTESDAKTPSSPVTKIRYLEKERLQELCDEIERERQEEQERGSGSAAPIASSRS